MVRIANENYTSERAYINGERFEEVIFEGETYLVNPDYRPVEQNGRIVRDFSKQLPTVYRVVRKNKNSVYAKKIDSERSLVDLAKFLEREAKNVIADHDY